MGKSKKVDASQEPQSAAPTVPVGQAKAMADAIPVYCAHDEIAPVERLVPNPRNPNTHPPLQIEILANIIREHGWRGPITVSVRSGFIVRGHGRYAAALKLGAHHVPVDYQHYPTEAMEWADLIADNRIAELAEMDTAKLKDMLVSLDDGQFDMTLTGFDQEALEDFLTTFPPAQDKGATDPAAEWKGMPEFDQQDKTAFRSIICHFKDSAAVDAFAQTVGQTITPNAKFIWYPEIEIAHVADLRYAGKGEKE